MFKAHLPLLACPNCGGGLILAKADREEGEKIESGALTCARCAETFPVQNGMPRFVPASNYTASFGYQWNLHFKTQYDSHTKVPVSRGRLFAETAWPERMTDQKVLEVGSGSGRFTEPLASTGATIVSLDYSQAVEANARNNGNKENVLIVQASIYNMPIPQASFDKVLCIGVLQHTPDVAKSFSALVNALKPGGELVIDVYRWRLVNFLWPRYWLRVLTKRLPSATVYRLCQAYVNRIWPLTKWIHRLPYGRKLNRFILVPDFRDLYPLSEDLLREWAILDTFDNLSPIYDQPQTLKAVKRWFAQAGLTDVQVRLGFNGIEGRGRKPLTVGNG